MAAEPTTSARPTKLNAVFAAAVHRTGAVDAKSETSRGLPDADPRSGSSSGRERFKADADEAPIPGDLPPLTPTDPLPAYGPFPGDGDVTAPVVYAIRMPDALQGTRAHGVDRHRAKHRNRTLRRAGGGSRRSWRYDHGAGVRMHHYSDPYATRYSVD